MSVQSSVEFVTPADCGSKVGNCAGCKEHGELRPAGKDGAYVCYNCAAKDPQSLIAYVSKRVGVNLTGLDSKQVAITALKHISMQIDALRDCGLEVYAIDFGDEPGERSMKFKADATALKDLLGEKDTPSSTFPCNGGIGGQA